MKLSDFLKKHKRKLLAVGSAGLIAGVGIGSAEFGRHLANKRRDEKELKELQFQNKLDAIGRYLPLAHKSVNNGILDYVKLKNPKEGDLNKQIRKNFIINFGKQFLGDHLINQASKVAHKGDSVKSQIDQLKLQNNIRQVGHIFTKGIEAYASNKFSKDYDKHK